MISWRLLIVILVFYIVCVGIGVGVGGVNKMIIPLALVGYEIIEPLTEKPGDEVVLFLVWQKNKEHIIAFKSLKIF